MVIILGALITIIALFALYLWRASVFKCSDARKLYESLPIFALTNLGDVISSSIVNGDYLLVKTTTDGQGYIAQLSLDSDCAVTGISPPQKVSGLN